LIFEVWELSNGILLIFMNLRSELKTLHLLSFEEGWLGGFLIFKVSGGWGETWRNPLR